MDDVISLGIGEPDFATPWHIREAAIYSLEKGRTGYSSNLGLPRLRRAISGYVEEHFGVLYEPLSEVLVSVGVSEAIDIALRAILNPGDEVLYHEPCYVSYSPSVVLARGVARAIPTKCGRPFRASCRGAGPRHHAALKAPHVEFSHQPHGRHHACVKSLKRSPQFASSTIWSCFRMKSTAN